MDQIKGLSDNFGCDFLFSDKRDLNEISHSVWLLIFIFFFFLVQGSYSIPAFRTPHVSILDVVRAYIILVHSMRDAILPSSTYLVACNQELFSAIIPHSSSPHGHTRSTAAVRIGQSPYFPFLSIFIYIQTHKEKKIIVEK